MSSSVKATQGTSLSPGYVGRIAGPAGAIIAYFALHYYAEELPTEGRATAAIAVLMGIWWMTEAVPLAVTSLLPLVLLPLCGVTPIDRAAAPYAEKNVFLYLGGFLIALAVERWNLHRRIALITLLAVGVNARNLIGGTMLATALISMWISNTATTLMMLPIALSLVAMMKERLGLQENALADGPAAVHRPHWESFATCMMLGVAYAATIGGLGTLVGTPTNLVLAGFADTQGIPIAFADWMKLGIPVAAIYLLIAWIAMTWFIFPQRLRELPGGRQLIREELANLGPMSRGEWTVATVFVLVALAWIFRVPLSQWSWLVGRFPAVTRIDDTMIAVAGGIALFLIPIDTRRGIFVLDWSATQRLPWGILLLFGGGFSLAESIKTSGLADWIGGSIAQLKEMPVLVLLGAVVLLIVALSEFASNTPTAAAFLPILYSVGQGIGVDPLLLLVPGALAASCSFMLPVGTPPNAIVFSSGHIRTGDMLRAGLFLDLLGVVFLPIAVYFLGPMALGIQVR